MKMESAKVCGLLAASLLVLTLLTDPTVACSCSPQNLKQAYCRSQFVLKAKVLDATIYPDIFKKIYKIKTTKVLKGPESLKNFEMLYTASHPAMCGYEHPTPFNEDEYVLGVRQYDTQLTISLCGIQKKWNDLSSIDKKGLEGDYKRNCPGK